MVRLIDGDRLKVVFHRNIAIADELDTLIDIAPAFTGMVKKNDVLDILHEVQEMKECDRKRLPYDAMIPDEYYHRLTVARILELPEGKESE